MQSESLAFQLTSKAGASFLAVSSTTAATTTPQAPCGDKQKQYGHQYGHRDQKSHGCIAQMNVRASFILGAAEIRRCQWAGESIGEVTNAQEIWEGAVVALEQKEWFRALLSNVIFRIYQKVWQIELLNHDGLCDDSWHDERQLPWLLPC